MPFLDCLCNFWTQDSPERAHLLVQPSSGDFFPSSPEHPIHDSPKRKPRPLDHLASLLNCKWPSAPRPPSLVERADELYRARKLSSAKGDDSSGDSSDHEARRDEIGTAYVNRMQKLNPVSASSSNTLGVKPADFGLSHSYGATSTSTTIFSPRPVLRFGVPRLPRSPRNRSLSVHVTPSSAQIGRRVTRSLFNLDLDDSDEQSPPGSLHFPVTAPIGNGKRPYPFDSRPTTPNIETPSHTSPPHSPRDESRQGRSRVRRHRRTRSGASAVSATSASSARDEAEAGSVVYKTIGLDGLPARRKPRLLA